MIYRFKGTATPFIKIEGKRSTHYVNPEHITSIRAMGGKVQIWLDEFHVDEGYGENEFFEITQKEFEEIFG